MLKTCSNNNGTDHVLKSRLEAFITLPGKYHYSHLRNEKPEILSG